MQDCELWLTTRLVRLLLIMWEEPREEVLALEVHGQAKDSHSGVKMVVGNVGETTTLEEAAQLQGPSK